MNNIAIFPGCQPIRPWTAREIERGATIPVFAEPEPEDVDLKELRLTVFPALRRFGG